MTKKQEQLLQINDMIKPGTLFEIGNYPDYYFYIKTEKIMSTTSSGLHGHLYTFLDPVGNEFTIRDVLPMKFIIRGGFFRPITIKNN